MTSSGSQAKADTAGKKPAAADHDGAGESSERQDSHSSRGSKAPKKARRRGDAEQEAGTDSLLAHDGGIWGNAAPADDGGDGGLGALGGWGGGGEGGEDESAGAHGGWPYDAAPDKQADAAAQADKVTPSVEDGNNVMPGAWQPPWGDPNMAASTNGLVDAPSW